MKKVTFLHSADLHLDSPMVGLKYLPEAIFKRLQTSTFKALINLIDTAIRHEVDFVIIAGDVFDGEDRSLLAQAKFRKELYRLFEKGIEVYVIHGNHDHLGGEWTKMEWPENVHVFGDEVEVKTFKRNNGPTVHLYGFSYPKRHVTERWIDKYEKQAGADFHIGILHGHFEGVSEHGKYAPFHLADLLDKQFDYWALGHIHKRSVLSEEPPIIYPGNPQGRHRKESGTKGCYIVSITENKIEYEFHETYDVLWVERTINGDIIKNFNELYDRCQQVIEEVRTLSKGVVLSLGIENLNSIDMSDNGSALSEELLETFHEQEKEEEDFVWVREIKWTKFHKVDRSKIAAQGDFFQELFSTTDDFASWEEAVSPLYRHHSARKYLNDLDEEAKKQLLQDAETKLLQLLYKE